MERIPKGRLFSSRRFGRYGSYFTWRMAKVLALLSLVEKEDRAPWTSSTLAAAVEMNEKSMQRLLARMRKKGWVLWSKDAFGRKAWIITPEGSAQAYRQIRRHVRFEVKKGEFIAYTLIKVVDKAIRALKKMKLYGFGDIQAREMLINYNISKIEWAISVAEYRQYNVDNMGAYIRTLIENGNQHERRCRIYLKKAAPAMPEYIREEIIREALRTVNPLTTAAYVAGWLHGHRGKSLKELSKEDVGEVCFALCKAKKIIYKKVHWFVA